MEQYVSWQNILIMRYRDMEFLAEYGYIGMFFMALLAASVLPLGSEWLLVLLLIDGFDPIYTVAAASVGNYLGGYSTYLVGKFGSDFWTYKVFRISEKKADKGKRVFNTYGGYSLLFSWVPIIGDVLCFVAGVVRYSFVRFSMFVLVGKAFRYSSLAYITLKSAEYLAK